MRCVGPGRSEWIALVEVNGVTVSFDFPVGRDRHLHPVAVIELVLKMPDRYVGGPVQPMKLP